MAVRGAARQIPLILSLGASTVAAAPGLGAPAHGSPPAAFAPARVAPGDAASLLWADPHHPLPPPAARARVEDAARWYLAQHAGQAGLPAGVAEGAVVRKVHDPGRGAVVVVFGQEVMGVEVADTRASVLMDRAGRLVAIGGGLRDLRAAERPDAYRSTAFEAAAEAASLALGVDVLPGELSPEGVDDGGWQRLALGPTPGQAAARVRLHRPARLRPVLYPWEGALVRAWEVEIDAGGWDGDGPELRAFILGDDGALLKEIPLTDPEAFNYRVWAQPAGDRRPEAGPHAPYAPHPAGYDDGSFPPSIPPTLVAVEGLSFTSDRLADPWLAPNADLSFGNNVFAYADLSQPDGYSSGDVAASVTSPFTFDTPYDTSLEPLASPSQTSASVVAAFYTTNWLHDWYYDSGFTEAAGNAQLSNYERGGAEGDPLLAEVQDQALDKTVRNNANMSTPADGASPRMQLYLWGAYVRATLYVSGEPEAISAGYATFGPTNFDVSGGVVFPRAADGAPEDGCIPYTTDVVGKIVLTPSPSCFYQDAADAAQAAGAVAIVIGDYDDDRPFFLVGPVDAARPATMPILTVPKDVMAHLAERADAGPLTGAAQRVSGVERDSALDATVVSHEWGHYLRRRLIQSCSSAECLAAGEGLSDYVALHMIYPEGGDRAGAYAHAIYAAHDDDGAGWYGSRRTPYSADPSIDGLTLRHMGEDAPLPADPPMRDNGYPNSEVHNAGEVLATMMWEVYMTQMGRAQGDGADRSFEEVQRAAADDLVTSFLLVPAEASFLDHRDALLAAVAARDEGELQAVTEAFARRGAGTCAEGPAPGSTRFTGVVEDFDLHPQLAVESVRLVEGEDSCDGDGILDAGESGEVIVTAYNRGALPLDHAPLSLVMDPALLRRDALPLSVDDLAPGERQALRVPVDVDPSLTGAQVAKIIARFDDAGACQPQVEGVLDARINADDHPDGETVDAFDSDHLVWTQSVVVGNSALWVKEASGGLSGDGVAHGLDVGAQADVRLTSPPLTVRRTADLVVTLRHRYHFEASDFEGQFVLWDGGVIEVSTDGQRWIDASFLADVPYDGTLSDQAENPLATRQAFAGASPGWPAWSTLTLDFGRAFAGQTVWLRLRVGCDLAAGDEGWFVDDVAVQGISNAPFSWVEGDEACDAPATPTEAPTPTAAPTEAPTPTPTAPPPTPTATAEPSPTASPTPSPTPPRVPATAPPTEEPTAAATEAATASPTAAPTEAPTAVSTEAPATPPGPTGTRAPDPTPTEGETAAPTPTAQAPSDPPGGEATDPPATPTAPEDGGCGCASARPGPSSSAAWLLFAAAWGLGRIRRRRHARA